MPSSVSVLVSELASLLVKKFGSTSDMRTSIRDHLVANHPTLADEVLSKLPQGSVSPADLADAAADLLVRRGIAEALIAELKKPPLVEQVATPWLAIAVGFVAFSLLVGAAFWKTQRPKEARIKVLLPEGAALDVADVTCQGGTPTRSGQELLVRASEGTSLKQVSCEVKSGLAPGWYREDPGPKAYLSPRSDSLPLDGAELDLRRPADQGALQVRVPFGRLGERLEDTRFAAPAYGDLSEVEDLAIAWWVGKSAPVLEPAPIPFEIGKTNEFRIPPRSPADAPEGVRVRVIDEATRLGIEGVAISFEDRTVYSDADGYFTLPPLPASAIPSTRGCDIEKPGYLYTWKDIPYTSPSTIEADYAIIPLTRLTGFRVIDLEVKSCQGSSSSSAHRTCRFALTFTADGTRLRCAPSASPVGPVEHACGPYPARSSIAVSGSALDDAGEDGDPLTCSGKLEPLPGEDEEVTCYRQQSGDTPDALAFKLEPY